MADDLTLLVVVPDDADPSAWCDLAAGQTAVQAVLACPENRNVKSSGSHCTVVHSEHGRSIFHMWGAAMRHASSTYLAVADARCPPAPTWLAAARHAMADGVPAFFGPVSFRDTGDRLSVVEYLLEYGQFAPPVDRTMNQVPGNNFVFRRDLLDQRALRDGQFHKVFFVDALRLRGLPPVFCDGLEVFYSKRYRRQRYLVRRFAHGRTYAALRSHEQGLGMRLLRGLSSPVLPLLRIGRVAGSISGKPELRAALLRHIAYAVAAETAWSLGECVGYLTARPGDPADLD